MFKGFSDVRATDLGRFPYKGQQSSRENNGILGVGIGGMVVHKRARKISNPNLKPLEELLPISSGLMALSILLMTIFLIKVSLFQQILFAAMLAFIPFFFGGIFLAVAFQLVTGKSSKVYAADLIGAKIGSVLIVFTLKLGRIQVGFYDTKKQKIVHYKHYLKNPQNVEIISYPIRSI